METTNIDELMRRHLELAVRSHDAGFLIPALEAALAALQHEPPSCDSPLLQFLIHPALTAIYRTGPAAAALRRYLQAHGEIRRETLWWVRFYLQGSEDDGEAEHLSGLPRGQLTELAEFLDREPAGEEPAPPGLTPLPPGCARCVLVEPSGQARVTRVHVRFGRWGRLDQDPIVGQAVPGAKAALDAARHYLAAAGCESIEGLQAEVLVEGLFRPVQGESLALAIFAAAVSARLQMPLPGHFAFTGAIGTPSVGAPAGAVMPVDEIRAKLAACGQAGCSHLMVPAHLLPETGGQLAHGPCALEPVTTTVEAIERVLPHHRFPQSPRVVGWREFLGHFVRAMIPGRTSPGDALRHGRHRAYRTVVPLFFAAMITERWLFADYLVPEYYLGVFRPPVWLAIVLGVLVAALMAATILASMRVVTLLLDRGATVNWWLSAGVLLTGCVLAWLPAQLLIRDPFAPPPRGVPLEHRTFQGWKDTVVVFLYALIFFVSPYTRVRLAEGAAAAGRLRWAREIVEGRRLANATFPAATVPLLVVIASVGMMGLAYLEWQALTDPSRAGSGPGNGPWRAIHIVGRAHLYLLSCVAALWWLGHATHQAMQGTGEDSP
jgi:hypothetical protein